MQSIAAPRLSWRGDVASGVQFAEWPVALGENRVRNTIVVVRANPTRLRFVLDIARNGGQMLPWSVAVAPANARLALNAGQFTDEAPWGWVVHKSRELRPRGTGPLAGTFVVDSTGAVSLLTERETDAWYGSGRAVEAFQSYPRLLDADARPPAALCDATGGLDRTHRDARLAIGITRDGIVLIALSRLVLPGGIASRVPIGPTTPEMAEIMRRIGAERALMLDGGLSAQLLVRRSGTTTSWPGLRSVPLALIAVPAPTAARP